MNKVYQIYLDNNLIGTSHLEKGDAPMGVVTGKIKFVDKKYNYSFFKNYCIDNSIKIYLDDLEFKCISTSGIAQLKIKDKKENEIVGITNTIEGMDNDYYDVTIIGIAYPFYEEEFPHHIKLYNDKKY